MLDDEQAPDDSPSPNAQRLLKVVVILGFLMSAFVMFVVLQSLFFSDKTENDGLALTDPEKAKLEKDDKPNPQTSVKAVTPPVKKTEIDDPLRISWPQLEARFYTFEQTQQQTLNTFFQKFNIQPTITPPPVTQENTTNKQSLAIQMATIPIKPIEIDTAPPQWPDIYQKMHKLITIQENSIQLFLQRINHVETH